MDASIVVVSIASQPDDQEDEWPPPVFISCKNLQAVSWHFCDRGLRTKCVISPAWRTFKSFIIWNGNRKGRPVRRASWLPWRRRWSRLKRDCSDNRMHNLFVNESSLWWMSVAPAKQLPHRGVADKQKILWKCLSWVLFNVYFLFVSNL